MSAKRKSKRKIQKEIKKQDHKLMRRLANEELKLDKFPIWFRSTINQATEFTKSLYQNPAIRHENESRIRYLYYWLHYVHGQRFDDLILSDIVPSINRLVRDRLLITMALPEVQTAQADFNHQLEVAKAEIAKVSPNGKKGLLGIPLALP